MIIFSALLLAGATPATATQEPADDKSKVTCHYEKDLSSRIVRRKVCLTAEERRQRDRDATAVMGDLNRRHAPGNSGD